MECALSQGPVPEECDCDSTVRSELGRGRGSHGNGKAGGDDSVGAEDPDTGVGDVHRATPSPVRSRLLPHQLGEHVRAARAPWPGSVRDRDGSM